MHWSLVKEITIKHENLFFLGIGTYSIHPSIYLPNNNNCLNNLQTMLNYMFVQLILLFNEFSLKLNRQKELQIPSI